MSPPSHLSKSAPKITTSSSSPSPSRSSPSLLPTRLLSSLSVPLKSSLRLSPSPSPSSSPSRSPSLMNQSPDPFHHHHHSPSLSQSLPSSPLRRAFESRSPSVSSLGHSGPVRNASVKEQGSERGRSRVAKTNGRVSSTGGSRRSSIGSVTSTKSAKSTKSTKSVKSSASSQGKKKVVKKVSRKRSSSRSSTSSTRTRSSVSSVPVSRKSKTKSSRNVHEIAALERTITEQAVLIRDLETQVALLKSTHDTTMSFTQRHEDDVKQLHAFYKGQLDDADTRMNRLRAELGAREHALVVENAALKSKLEIAEKQAKEATNATTKALMEQIEKLNNVVNQSLVLEKENQKLQGQLKYSRERQKLSVQHVDELTIRLQESIKQMRPLKESNQ